MSFKPLDQETLRIIDGTVNSSSVIKLYCGHFLKGLQKFYSHQHVQLSWDVGFSFDEKFRCNVETPYGNARGALSIQIVDGSITGRYIFEKRIVSESGDDEWSQIFVVRITGQGNVLLGSEGELSVEVQDTHTYSNAFETTARTLLYLIGACATYR